MDGVGGIMPRNLFFILTNHIRNQRCVQEGKLWTWTWLGWASIMDDGEFFFNEHIRQRYGTLLAGGLCGIGVWAWVDGLVLSTTKVRFMEHKTRHFSSCTFNVGLGIMAAALWTRFN
jgi:hypothetical protein